MFTGAEAAQRALWDLRGIRIGEKIDCRLMVHCGDDVRYRYAKGGQFPTKSHDCPLSNRDPAKIHN